MLLHAFAGVVCALQPQLVIAWVLYVIIIEGGFKVIRSRNAPFQAAIVAAYMAALEMVVRMSRSGLPHELTKYAVIFILLNGLLAGSRSRKNAGIFIFFFLLLIPSILMINTGDLEEARQAISFNLAGPLCLAVSGFYFYHRPLSRQQLVQLSQRFLPPIAATVAWLFVSTPSISEISFSFGANFAASGYGPNQMASILGFGILVIGLSLLFRLPVFQSRVFALVFLALIGYRGLLTFSRGGMLTPLLVLGLLILYFTLTDRSFSKQVGRIVLLAGLFALSLYGIFSYTNQQTGGALFNRFAGISNDQQVTLEKYSSGRLDIINIDLAIFMDYPILGIGPGMGNDLREEYGYGYNVRVAAHVEYSRLLAEHGVFGMVALLLLLGIPTYEFFRRKSIQQRFLLVAGVLFCLAFMSHSATRIALPMFAYGLGFILLTPNQSTRPNPTTKIQHKTKLINTSSLT